MLIFLNGICKGDMKEVSVYPFSQRENIIPIVSLDSTVLCVFYCFAWLHIMHLEISQLPTSDKHDEFRYTQSTATWVRLSVILLQCLNCYLRIGHKFPTMQITYYWAHTEYPSILNVIVETLDAIGKFRPSIKTRQIPVYSIVYL